MVDALAIAGLRKSYRRMTGGRIMVLDGAALRIRAGEAVALVGASGGGKTTLLHCAAGLVRPDGGSIRVAGTELTTLRESARDRLRARAVGIVFQTFNLLQGLSALENVTLAMALAGAVDRTRAVNLLEAVGLGDRLAYRPEALSAGQQQRVAVARALANRPALVLADEPTGALDAPAAQRTLDLLCGLCAETRAALCVVSHEADVVERFARVERLEDLNVAAPDPR